MLIALLACIDVQSGSVAKFGVKKDSADALRTGEHSRTLWHFPLALQTPENPMGAGLPAIADCPLTKILRV
jgi:hypothetical protein